MSFDRLIVVMNGPSASGKTTVIEAIAEGQHVTPAAPTLAGVEKLVTVTTRPMRDGEIHGIHYHFLTPETFEEEKVRGNIAEETVYAGVKYGILDSEIRRIQAAGRDAIVALDMHGVSEMKRFYGEENVISIFIHRDLKDIRMELAKRNVPQAEKDRRFEQAKGEMKNIAKNDFVVYNIGTIDDLVADVIAIIRDERAKRQNKILNAAN